MSAVKPYKPTATDRVQDMLRAGQTQIPAKLVRGLIKEWERETGWHEKMCQQIVEASIRRYGP